MSTQEEKDMALAIAASMAEQERLDQQEVSKYYIFVAYIIIYHLYIIVLMKAKEKKVEGPGDDFGDDQQEDG